MKTALLTIAIALMPGLASAQRAKSPAEATVFIRLIGSVHAEFDEARDQADGGRGSRRDRHRQRVRHLALWLRADQRARRRERRPAPGDQRADSAPPSRSRCRASTSASVRGRWPRADWPRRAPKPSVTASDPALDLAVLFVGGASNLPYLPLGDSDVVARRTRGGCARVSVRPRSRSRTSGDRAGSGSRRQHHARRHFRAAQQRRGRRGDICRSPTASIQATAAARCVTRDGFAVGVIQSKLIKAPPKSGLRSRSTK